MDSITISTDGNDQYFLSALSESDYDIVYEFMKSQLKIIVDLLKKQGNLPNQETRF